ncbi:MAG: hypothetical protein KME06_09435 [Kastovskya adunca ATA6-11-RM4]|jgi:hypothetical protein|nr:hypothetical protein [Kastovskya adunca ATA6-11-RM4]
MAHPPIRGKDVKITIALLGKKPGDRIKPTPETLAIGAAGPAKGATTITLAGAPTNVIQSGQRLLFVDEDGNEFIAVVSAKPTSTALSVRALDEAIPPGATAQFPVKMWDRTDSGVDRSYNMASVNHYDDGGTRDGVSTGSEKNISLPGIYYEKNAGLITCLHAADQGIPIWIRRELPPPSDAFSTGRVIEGAGLITGAPDSAPTDNFVTMDLNASFVGDVLEVSPLAVA